MTRSKESPGGAAYYEAMQRIFRLESEVLTAVLPHAGERGANDEARCRAFLEKVLPRRYSIGTGFIVSSDPDLPVSPQQDIVIYDEFLNSPLHRELSAFVFPIEIVYATVEVKGLLQQKDLVPTVESIGKARKLGMKCWYQRIVSSSETPGRFPQLETLCVKKPARAFVFAFETSYATAEGFRKAWQKALDKVGTAHIHGVVVLNKNWYAFQVPYETPARVKIFTDHALMRFMNGMLHLLRSTRIYEAATGRYLKIETPPSENAGEVEPDQSKESPPPRRK